MLCFIIMERRRIHQKRERGKRERIKGKVNQSFLDVVGAQREWQAHNLTCRQNVFN